MTVKPPRHYPNPVYASFIADEVGRQAQRKESLETRGFAALAASGGIATVLLGVVSLTKKNGTGLLPQAAHGWVRLALIFFAAGAVAAFLSNFPAFLKWADPDDLRRLVDQYWGDDRAEAEKEVAKNHVDVLESLFFWNDLKGWSLAVSMLLQAVGIVWVAIAVWVAL